MGGKRSGRYFRPKIVFGTYKVYGLIDSCSTDYWYYGVSRNYLTNVKHLYISNSRLNKSPFNLMFNKIKELDYKFQIVELERLPRDIDRNSAKLYLQEKYLTPNETKILNKQHFSKKDPFKVVKKQLTRYIKQGVVQLYMEGYKSRDISEKFDVSMDQILNILKYAKQTKHDLYKKSLQLYKEGKTIPELKKQNPQLSPYLIRKIKAEA